MIWLYSFPLNLDVITSRKYARSTPAWPRSNGSCASLHCFTLLVIALLSLTPPAHAIPVSPSSNNTPIRLNHVQFKATHNSYHREQPLLSRPFFKLLLPSPQNYYYSHASLTDQLSAQSVRSFELDLHADYAAPGQYSNPLIARLAELPAPPQRWTETMRQPGAKVLHVPDADVFSSCASLAACLAELRAWSEAHAAHVPLVIDLEFKQPDERMARLGGTKGENWTTATLEAVDAEIRASLAPAQLLTPDDLRLRPDAVRRNLTLEQSVLQLGWPELRDCRGKVLFVMDNDPEPGSVRDAYRAGGHANLDGRVVFTNSVPGEPDAAFVKRNDPRGKANRAEIQDLVRRGYLVRTRADEPLDTVLTGDVRRREEAWASGAQIVSTDWPAVGMAARYDSDYVVELPGGGTVRCNPVNAPKGCVDAELEKLWLPDVITKAPAQNPMV
ncbi:uncharacterized protein K452DRAFT_253148 [Aplosporella prunicola CBS 121167]|uniref:Acid phosphatase n=1 Tax=Aplosporella prunicola CBS 121167 TaxID=1176127 RepID=A0A6A6B819_9PEZI|nr:uncharacterized protein K452DRAFT_253148 [Aplosporella prunicola CBS 121167]KAF2140352.1 hypothetical protein K452DRAFT_253148 [Aplosporella prunicola CBS 121167]